MWRTLAAFTALVGGFVDPLFEVPHALLRGDHATSLEPRDEQHLLLLSPKLPLDFLQRKGLGSLGVPKPDGAEV
jgi:hypothetical protein